MNYEFTPNALKQIKKLQKPLARRVINKLEYYKSQNNPLSFADHLTDSRLGTYRFRVGDYRIICDVENDTLVVLHIGHRRDIYRK